MNAEIWYLAKNGERIGPFTNQEVAAYGDAGNITPDTLAWCEGMNGWITAAAAGMRITAPAPAVVVRTTPVTYRKASPYAPVVVFLAVTLGGAGGGFVAIEAAKQYAAHQVANVVRKTGKAFAAQVEKDAAEWKKHNEEIQDIFAKASAAANAR